MELMEARRKSSGRGSGGYSAVASPSAALEIKEDHHATSTAEIIRTVSNLTRTNTNTTLPIVLATSHNAKKPDVFENNLFRTPSSLGTAYQTAKDLIEIQRTQSMAHAANADNNRAISRVSSTEESVNSPEEIMMKLRPGYKLPPKVKKSAKKHNEALKKEIDMDDHIIPLKAVYWRFQTDPVRGLTDEEAARRMTLFGANEMTPPKEVHWSMLLLHQMTNGFACLLWIAAIFCWIVYGIDKTKDKTNVYLGVVLALAVILTGLFAFYQEYNSSKIMAGFLKMLPSKARVYRNGKVSEVNARELVPGDIVDVQFGNKAPADLRVMEANELAVDNSSLTGEAEPQTRIVLNTHHNPLETKNLIFSGTNIAQGSGKGMVVLTGDDALIGRIAGLAAGTEKKASPIKYEVNHFVKVISVIALSVGAIFFLIGIKIMPSIILDVILSIGICVANVPEGLLATVVAALTHAAKRMAKCNVLVKQLESVETLGSCNTICSDKTGTLTQNRMTAQHVCFNLDLFSLGLDKGSPFPVANDLSLPSLQALLRVATLCSRSYFEKDEMGDPKYEDHDGKPTNVRKAFGDATEVGILRYTDNVVEVLKMHEENPKVVEIPFNSVNKFQLSIHRKLGKVLTSPFKPDVPEAAGPIKPGTRFIMMKGACERIIALCSTVLMPEGEVPMTPALRRRAEELAETLAARGERVLGFCQFVLDPRQFPDDYKFSTEELNFPVKDLCFAGLIGLIDPPRPSVPAALNLCRAAHVKVEMVTGDHPVTARAIAQQVNIISADSVITNVTELRTKDQDYKLTRDRMIQAGKLQKESETLLALLEQEQLKSAGKMSEDARLVCQLAIDTFTQRLAAIASELEGLVRENYSAKTFEDYRCELDEDKGKSGRAHAIVVTGEEVKTFEEADWNYVLAHHEIVFARTSPQQKLVIVEANQKRGGVVAVTGDGVNDSPALKTANIGVAMGIAGSEISKEAAAVVLLDDEFMSIVQGIKQGRLIFDNLKKSIAYTLQHLGPEVCPFLAYFIFKIPLPLTTVQILCIDLGTDIFPAISFANEDPESDIMTRRPRNVKTDKLAGWRLFVFAYLQMGIIETAGVFFTYFMAFRVYGFSPSDVAGTADNWGDEGRVYIGSLNGKPYDSSQQKHILKEVQTAVFLSIVIVQLGGLLACKTRLLSLFQQGMHNKFMNGAIVFEIAFACFIIYTPGVQDVVGMTDLRGVLWLPAWPFAFLLVFYDEIRKYLIRRDPKGIVHRLTYY